MDKSCHIIPSKNTYIRVACTLKKLTTKDTKYPVLEHIYHERGDLPVVYYWKGNCFRSRKIQNRNEVVDVSN